MKQSKNFAFANNDFLKLFFYKPYHFYNQFNCKNATSSLIDSMGEHPKYDVYFKYDEKRKIRATFIVFPDAKEELEVYSICVLFNASRFEYHCYFFEYIENGEIVCIEWQNEEERIIRKINMGTQIDNYFNYVCSGIGSPKETSTAMILYKSLDNCYRILDISKDEFDNRCYFLIGDVEKKEIEINGNKFVIYKSKELDDFIAVKIKDGIVPIDICMSDIDFIKSNIEKCIKK